MFVPAKVTVKLANGSTGHVQVIGIILCCFTNCSIIYTLGLIYYCTGHPTNTILSGYLKVYIVFQKVTSEPLEHYDFFDPQDFSWRSPYKTKTNISYLQIENSRLNPQRNSDIVVPNR